MDLMLFDAETGLSRLLASGTPTTSLFAQFSADGTGLVYAANDAGDGTGTNSFIRPEFLSRISLMTTTGAALFPGMELWTHADEPLRSAHDPVLWDALREQGTWRLFPEVFPARDGG